MVDTPNGLASMTQARERRARRVMPPPRHPVPAGSAEPARPEPERPAAENSAKSEQVDHPLASVETGPSQEPARPARRATPPKPEAIIPVGEEAAKPATLYLDGNLLDFLEEARIAGLVSKPRLDISKSAVVRLALRRLQRDMTVEEIREHLRSQPTDPTKTGRKKR